MSWRTAPIRVLDAVTSERLVTVDGAWGQPGLNLSHWPGHATPKELAHDLSTGVALRFARLSRARQDELAAGCVALANNHYDTDGVCALFAVREPDAALAREKELLDVAATGDLFRFPSERAYAIDLVIGGLADEQRSPLREHFATLDDRARRELVLNEAVRVLPELLDGALEPYAELWKRELEDALADRRDLATAAKDEIVHLDLAAWTAPHDARSSRANATAFDPGRHALLGSTSADRVLVVGPRESGTTYRFLVNTTSWFDLVSRRPPPRPDLAALAKRLNELEGARADDDLAWRAQPIASPSPELWFGGAEHAWFAEHCAALGPSRLAPTVVRAEIVEALRAAWTFPEDE